MTQLSRRSLIKGSTSLAFFGAMGSRAIAAPTAIYTKNFNTAEAGWEGYRIRAVIQPADLVAAPGLTLIRATLKFGGSTSGCTLDGLWLGGKGTGPVDFLGTQVQMKFSGADSVSGITGATTIVSDYVTFTVYNPAIALVVSFHLSGTAQPEKLASQSNVEILYQTGDNSQTGSTAPTGSYTSAGNYALLVELIEMDGAGMKSLPLLGVGR